MNITDKVDEIIAVLIVSGYLAAWFLNNQMPSEPLMIILGYYFGKKVTASATSN